MTDNFLNVLIVEDELIVAEEIRECLLQAGYHVIDAVPSSDEALQIIRNEQLDLVLLDVNIKGKLDGIELATQIRKTKDCPIVFLTAYSDQETIERAKKVRPESYLVKPFEQNNLRVAVEMACEKYQNHSTEGDSLKKEIETVFLKDENRYVRVAISDILIVEAQGSYCSVITRDKTYVYSFNLKTAIEKLVHPCLVRAHRSFLININNVDALEGNQLILGEHTVQMSQSHRDEIVNQLNII